MSRSGVSFSGPATAHPEETTTFPAVPVGGVLAVQVQAQVLAQVQARQPDRPAAQAPQACAGVLPPPQR
ncbi:hypothetical protein, partial [Roseibium sp.]|uniref:hypothetical protein n=1 Tax=Roseibium sp. TaxID=1936156 RepID=UPI003D0C981F